MKSVLIDKEGRFWSPASRILSRDLFLRHRDVSIVDYALANRGFIYVHGGSGSVTIFTESSHISSRSLTATRYAIGEQQPHEVVLVIKSKGRREVIVGELPALQRLEALLPAAARRAWFGRQTQAIAPLVRTSGDPRVSISEANEPDGELVSPSEISRPGRRTAAPTRKRMRHLSDL